MILKLWLFRLSKQSKWFFFDRHVTPDEDWDVGQFRLLGVDNIMVVSIQTYIRIIVLAAGVLHILAVSFLEI